jgi:hypothetical protein
MGNPAFFTDGSVMDLHAVGPPQAVILTAGISYTGLEAGIIPLGHLDRPDQVRPFHFAGFQPHLFCNTLNLIYCHFLTLD